MNPVYWGIFFARLRAVAGRVACQVGMNDGRFVDVAGGKFWTASGGRSEGGIDYDTVDHLCGNQGTISVHYQVVGDVVVVTGHGIVERFSIADVNVEVHRFAEHGWKHGQGNVVSRAVTRRAGYEWGAETPAGNS